MTKRTISTSRRSFFFQAEYGIRDAQESRGLGDVYKRQAQHFNSKHLPFLYRAPFKESHEIFFAADDARRLGWCKSDLYRSIRFRFSNDNFIVDTHVGVSTNVAVNSDNAEATIFRICRPHYRGCSVMGRYLDDVALSLIHISEPTRLL